MSSIPDGVGDFVMRISNPESMLNEKIRVQNEVAMMTLIRESLSQYNSALVPELYGWEPPSPTNNGRGWTLIEFKSGEPVSDHFPTLELQDKKIVLQQMAEILKCIQSFQLPESIKGYGGLGFDETDHSKIITGPTPISGGGPCGTLHELYAEYFQTQLAFAEQCDLVQGWKHTELPERIHNFRQALPTLWDDRFNPRPTLVHADFGMSTFSVPADTY